MSHNSLFFRQLQQTVLSRTECFEKRDICEFSGFADICQKVSVRIGRGDNRGIEFVYFLNLSIFFCGNRGCRINFIQQGLGIVSGCRKCAFIHSISHPFGLTGEIQCKHGFLIQCHCHCPVESDIECENIPIEGIGRIILGMVKLMIKGIHIPGFRILHEAVDQCRNTCGCVCPVA